MRRHLLADWSLQTDELQPENPKKKFREFKFELISPMIGGDSNSWILDEKNPIRGQSVKGQLRFWWRTMQKTTDQATLLNEENQLWGGEITGKDNKNPSRIKSPVCISITHDIATAEIKKTNLENSTTLPAYITFPISLVKNIVPIVVEKLTFSLKISYPIEKEEETIDTLKLWMLFGGIGARTRRGTGSIYSQELMEDFSSVEDIATFLKTTGTDDTTALDYPRIAGSRFFTNTPSEKVTDSFADWHDHLEKYKNYRQNRVKPMGKSRWPEPEAIRERYVKNYTSSHPAGDFFPRANFGLPMKMEFHKCENGLQSRTFTVDTGNKNERFPSPVIIKILKFADGRVCRCALVLNQKFPDELTLREETGEKKQTTIKFAESFEPKTLFIPKNEGGVSIASESVSCRSEIYAHLAKELGLREVK